MKILDVKQIRACDAHTIRHEAVSSLALMERVAVAASNWIASRYDKSMPVQVFCGTGNNGGDGLSIARLLHNRGYNVRVHILRAGGKFTPDFSANEARIRQIPAVGVTDIKNAAKLPPVGKHDLVVDALWGSGLTRPVTGWPAKVIEHINKSGAAVVAVDIPSGLFADMTPLPEGTAVVQAQHTLAFELPKLSFFFPQNYPYVGDWEIISIDLSKSFIEKAKTDNYFLAAGMIAPLLHHRKKFDHKGTFGHALIVAGGHGRMGAAVLAARGCLRSGAGLVTCYIPSCGYEIMQSSVPEVMVENCKHEMFLTENGLPDMGKYNTAGIGPGISTCEGAQNALKDILQKFKKPVVLDADALNILSAKPDGMKHIPPGSILTPHPGEFDRLVGGKVKDDYHRHDLQVKLAKKLRSFVILKRAYTVIATPHGECYFNSTGNPGMATGGSGDVLCGLLAGLLAQGYGGLEASLIGVYVHGLAGDLAAASGYRHGMTASDIVDRIPAAFLKLNAQSTS